MRATLMKWWLLAMVLAAGAASAQAEETIVFFRHGEKPAGGLGQLTCQGLNRALALPGVLLDKFGTPDYLYAPNPAVEDFRSRRQLLLRTPPGHDRTRRDPSRQVGEQQYGYNDVTGLRSILVTSSEGQRHGLRLLGTRLPGEGGPEHHECVRRWRHGPRMDAPATTTACTSSGINYANGSIDAQFERDREGLNGLPTACPG